MWRTLHCIMTFGNHFEIVKLLPINEEAYLIIACAHTKNTVSVIKQLSNEVEQDMKNYSG